MNSIEKRMKKDFDEKFFGSFDVCCLTIEFKGFTDRGVVVCAENLDDFTKTLKSCLEKNKHPGLNPVVDKIYQYKEESEGGFEAIKKFILSEADINTFDLDNKRDVIEMKLKIDVMFVNLEAFIEEEKLSIIEAKIQGPLFAKEY